MEYEALVSFSGAISMSMGEVREIEDPAIVNDLLKAGYIQPNVGSEPRPSAVIDKSKIVDNEPPNEVRGQTGSAGVKEAVEKSKLKDNQSAPRVRGQKGGKTKK